MRTLLAHTRRAALAVVLVLSLATVLALPAQAQPVNQPAPAYEEPDRLAFGLRAGVNSSDFYGQSVEVAEPELGINAGLFLTYRLTPRLAIQPEVLFSEQEAKIIQSRAFEDAGTIDYNLGYLDVPLLLKAHLGQRGWTDFNIHAGPFAGVNLYSGAEDRRGALEAVDLDEELRSMRYGALFGVGFEGHAAGRTVSLDLRYKHGLTNLFEAEDRPTFRDRGFMLSLGLSL